MAEHDRKESGEIVKFHRWEGVENSQLEQIRQALKAHSQFNRVIRLEGSLSELPSSIELYQDDRKNYVGFMYPGSRHGQIIVISDSGSTPIIEDILGPENAPLIEF